MPAVFPFPAPLKYRHFLREAHQEHHVLVTGTRPLKTVPLRTPNVAQTLLLTSSLETFKDDQRFFEHFVGRNQFVIPVGWPVRFQMFHLLRGNFELALARPRRIQPFESVKPFLRSHIRFPTLSQRPVRFLMTTKASSAPYPMKGGGDWHFYLERIVSCSRPPKRRASEIVRNQRAQSALQTRQNKTKTCRAASYRHSRPSTGLLALRAASHIQGRLGVI